MYVLYLNDYERIIAIDDNLWIIHPLAKLLSSKLSLCICEIPNSSKLNNSSCLKWTIETPELPLSIQYPKLLISNNHVLVEKDYPQGIDLEILLSHQQYVLKSLKVLSAAKITDAILNTGDRLYFQKLLDFDYTGATPDESGIEQGFLKSIEKIIYLSKDVSEIEKQIRNLFTLENSIFPRNLSLYNKTFLKYLNE
jgi:hypothetical protein